MKTQYFPVVITQDEDGWYVAECQAIPSCFTQGKTYEEALKNIQEAIELCLEVAEDDPEYKALIDYEQGKQQRTIGISTVNVPNPQFA